MAHSYELQLAMYTSKVNRQYTSMSINDFAIGKTPTQEQTNINGYHDNRAARK